MRPGYWIWLAGLVALPGWTQSRNGSQCTAVRRKRRHVGRLSMDAPYRIRSAVPADAAPLVAIERRCFSDPWSETSFREALESPWTFGLVAQAGRGIAGYLIGREVAGTARFSTLRCSPISAGQAWRERSCGPAWFSRGSGESRRSIWRCGSRTSRPRHCT